MGTHNRRRSGIGLMTTALAVLAVLAAAVLGRPGPAAALESSTDQGQPGADVTPVAHALGTGADWSSARMLRAEGIEAPAAAGGDHRSRSGSAELFAARTPYRSRVLPNTTSYPNRVHGRVFGTYPLVGDFSCSGTVISTGSANLIATAGHCVYDAGGSEQFVSELTFVPGYDSGAAPFGVWEATHVLTTDAWVTAGSLDFDVAFAQLAPDPQGQGIEELVGSRGIAFNQPRQGRLRAFGYPSSPAPPYDGSELIRCDSRFTPDIVKHSSTPSMGMGCDMQQGSSGGGWVRQDSFVVSNVSHGHPSENSETFYGPYYGKAVRSLYGFEGEGYPSTDPVRCGGRIANIIGTDSDDRIRGTKRRDVIATLGGNDVVRSKGGRDRICAGTGNDRIVAGGGRDRLLGGQGRDRCDGGGGRDRARSCERTQRIR